jgi:hypothetical protein
MSVDDPSEPLRFTTAREMLAGGYRLAGYYPHCERWAEVDLARLVREGKGDRCLIPVRVRCRRCGELGQAQLRAPVPGSPGYEPRNKPGGGL